jgi:aspartyl-tRNA(Asn)/glutamyl-tRNA(Gln) amidotransferase subunit C
MSSPDLDVRYVARLARIGLTEEEASTFEDQLRRVLEHIEHLKQLDVSSIEPTAHTYPIFNITRPDLPGASISRELALNLAPRAVNNLIIVPKVVE